MNIKKTELMKLVKSYCLECSGGEKGEVRLCTVTRCKLYPVRMGNATPEVEGAVKDKPVRTKAPMSADHKEALRIGREKRKAEKGA